MAAPSESISFRLPAELIRALDKQRNPFGDSRGEYSKRAMIAHLLRDRDDAVTQQLLELRQSFAMLDDELQLQNESLLRAVRRLAFALLTLEEPLPLEQARLIVRQISSHKTDGD